MSVSFPAFPILHYKKTEGGVELDIHELGAAVGTAVYITQTGLFLTAAHVVDGYPETSPSLSVFVIVDGGFRPMPVVNLAIHPELDAAIGRTLVPKDDTLKPPVLALGSGELAPDELVITYGYSHTQTKTASTEQENYVALNFNPKPYPGKVIEHHPGGLGFVRGSVYSIGVTHNGAARGGISGGPIARNIDSACYGIYSRGGEGDDPYLLATHIAQLLDWPVAFLGGRTLRELASANPAVLEIR